MTLTKRITNLLTAGRHPHAGRPGQVGGSVALEHGLAPAKGTLGRLGYFVSDDPNVRLSAQVDKDKVFVTRLDAVEQGKGHGSAALERLKRFAAKTGRRVELTDGADTKELQDRLNKFYEKHGFTKTVDGEHPSYVWKASVATRITNVLKASSPTSAEARAHDAARERAKHIYEAALIAASLHAAHKRRLHDMESVILLALLLAGEDAYVTTHNFLGDNLTGGTGGRAADQTQIAEQAATFAAGRQPLLTGFADTLAIAIRKAKRQAAKESATAGSLTRTLRHVARNVGHTMLATEAQATYGSVQIDRLARAGFATKVWQTMDDDRVRPSHVECGEQGAVPLDKPFVNGLKYPGDPAGGPEECCGCRCWLSGGSR